MQNINKIDIEKVVAAVEKDAGQPVPGLRQGLREMQGGVAGKVHTPAQLLVREARASVGLSQQAFARRIKTPVATLRDWEQGRFTPPGAVLCLLKMLVSHPELAEELVA